MLGEMLRMLVIEQPGLVNRDRPIILQENAEPHVAVTTLLKLQQLDLETLSPTVDLAPTD